MEKNYIELNIKYRPKNKSRKIMPYFISILFVAILFYILLYIRYEELNEQLSLEKNYTQVNKNIIENVISERDELSITRTDVEANYIKEEISKTKIDWNKTSEELKNIILNLESNTENISEVKDNNINSIEEKMSLSIIFSNDLAYMEFRRKLEHISWIESFSDTGAITISGKTTSKFTMNIKTELLYEK